MVMGKLGMKVEWAGVFICQSGQAWLGGRSLLRWLVMRIPWAALVLLGNTSYTFTHFYGFFSFVTTGCWHLLAAVFECRGEAAYVDVLGCTGGITL